MFALVLLLLLQFVSSSSQAVGYPIRLDEPGDFIVQGPLISDVPEGAEMHPAPLTRLRMFSPQVISHPMFPLVSRNAIRTLLEEGALSSDASSPQYIQYMLEKAADSMDDFNPSILDGDRTPRQVAIFYSYFFELFKLTYPGLRRVKIKPMDLHNLANISYSISISPRDAEGAICTNLCRNLNDFSRKGSLQVGYDLDLFKLIRYKCKYSVLAIKNMTRLEIRPRADIEMSDDFSFDKVIGGFLHNRDIFLDLLPYVQNINESICYTFNDQFSGYGHVLLAAIANGKFYEEAMLRPELKYYHAEPLENVIYEDFYSLALGIAFKQRNIPALLYLLRLDDSYYEGFPTSDDTSADSDDISYESNHPPPVSINELNGLRALFLSETLDQIYQRYPDINNFKFLESSALDIACLYKSDFPALNQLFNNLRRSNARASAPKRRKTKI